MRKELLGVVRTALTSISTQVSSSIQDLARGQMSVENQFMASLRHSTVHTKQVLFALQSYLRHVGVGQPAAVPLTQEEIEALFAPPPNYADANFHLSVWMELRQRRPNDFKDYMEAYVEGRLTLDEEGHLSNEGMILLPEAPEPPPAPKDPQVAMQEAMAAMASPEAPQLAIAPEPPEDAESVPPQTVGELGPDASDLEAESDQYGGAAIFGGDLADDYAKRVAEESEEEPVDAPVTPLEPPDPREVTGDITGEFDLREGAPDDPLAPSSVPTSE